MKEGRESNGKRRAEGSKQEDRVDSGLGCRGITSYLGWRAVIRGVDEQVPV
jgi:hypothetical protein